MPKEEIASLADPRFAKGDLKVLTYIEGRSVDVEDRLDLNLQA
jgi:hypothetical protein